MITWFQFSCPPVLYTLIDTTVGGKITFMNWDTFHTAFPSVGMEQGKCKHLSFQTVHRTPVVHFNF